MVYILRQSQSSHHKAGHSQTQLKQVKRCVIIDKTKWGNSSQRGNKGNSQKRYEVATYCGNTSPMTRSVRIMTLKFEGSSQPKGQCHTMSEQKTSIVFVATMYKGVLGVVHEVRNDLAVKTFVRGAEALLCT